MKSINKYVRIILLNQFLNKPSFFHIKNYDFIIKPSLFCHYEGYKITYLIIRYLLISANKDKYLSLSDLLLRLNKI